MLLGPKKNHEPRRKQRRAAFCLRMAAARTRYNRSVMRLVLLAVLGCAAAGQMRQAAPAPASPPAENPAPENPVLQYEGKPITLPFRCTEEDLAWAGLSCSESEPCPTYLELAAVESAGNRIFAIGNIHSDAVTLYSVLLASDDAGKTWRETFNRIRGAGLDHIQFLDFESGWISGQALFPLPQDPFVLITTDGGRSWRQHNLFADSRVGSITQFWFSSKNNGALIVDRGQGAEGSRYELYESPNAGETWMVRETSDRQLRLKRGPSGFSAWRIRADGPSKSFRIERQAQTDRWSTVAAFHVALGVCQPPPPAEVAEPAPAPEQEAAPAAIPSRTAPPSLRRPPR